MGIYIDYHVAVRSNSDEELDRFMAYLDLKKLREYSEEKRTEYESDRLGGLINHLKREADGVFFIVTYKVGFKEKGKHIHEFFRQLRGLKLCPTLRVTYTDMQLLDVWDLDEQGGIVEDWIEYRWSYALGCCFEENRSGKHKFPANHKELEEAESKRAALE